MGTSPDPPIKTLQLCFAQNFGRAVASNLATHFLVAPAVHIHPFPLLSCSPEADLCSSTCIQQERHHKSREAPHDAELGEDRVVLRRGNGRRCVRCSWRGRTGLSRHTGTFGQFCSHLDPLRSLMAKVLDDSEPVHDEIDTTHSLMSYM